MFTPRNCRLSILNANRQAIVVHKDRVLKLLLKVPQVGTKDVGKAALTSCSLIIQVVMSVRCSEQG